MLPAESNYVEKRRERERVRVRETRRRREERGGHDSRSSSKKKVERRMVGGGKARLESRAWLEARISVNNSRPTACIFLPDSFSLFPRSRKCDKIIRGRFNFFPNLSGTFHDTFINYDNFMDKFLYLRIISATNVEKFHILSIFQFNNNLSWLFILLTIIHKYDSNLIIKIPLPKFYEFLRIHCYYT